MHIAIESKDESVVSMLENKLNETDKYIVFDVEKEIPCYKIPVDVVPSFQRFLCQFEKTKIHAKEEHKNILVKGLGDFLVNANMSMMEQSFIQWHLWAMGFCVVVSGETEFSEFNSPVVTFHPNSDFYKDLKIQLDCLEKSISEDYLFRTFSALNADGYFLGNFHAEKIIEIPISGRKLYLEDIVKEISEQCPKDCGLGNLLADFISGKVSFVKKDHPFSCFVENAKN